MTIRDRIRKWLGIDQCATYAHMNVNLAAKQSQIDALESAVEKLKAERAELIAKLKARNVVPMMPMYKDYESAQVDALQEFKEK